MDDQNISGPINAPTPQPPAADQLTEIEKQMTGFERATLRGTKAAVFMSFLAAGFVCLQWIEMRNGATDTHTLAVAAKTQAEKMSSMSDAAEKIRDASQNLVAETKKTADSSQKAIQESNRQSQASLDATIANGRLEQRAWVAELAMQMDGPEVAIGNAAKYTA
jgi:DNA anti-recombination protein RmuC